MFQILAEISSMSIYLKCIFSVTNFQKSPSAGGSPPLSALFPSVLVIWICIIWQNCSFSN